MALLAGWKAARLSQDALQCETLDAGSFEALMAGILRATSDRDRVAMCGFSLTNRIHGRALPWCDIFEFLLTRSGGIFGIKVMVQLASASKRLLSAFGGRQALRMTHRAHSMARAVLPHMTDMKEQPADVQPDLRVQGGPDEEQAPEQFLPVLAFIVMYRADMLTLDELVCMGGTGIKLLQAIIGGYRIRDVEYSSASATTTCTTSSSGQLSC